jgi:hypothetical protein
MADDERADSMTHTAPSLCPDPELAPAPCTKCGAPVHLARVEPAKPDFDLRTFECTKCNNVDQYIVEYGTNAAWALIVR